MNISTEKTKEGLSGMVEQDLVVIAISFVLKWTISPLLPDRRETCRQMNVRGRCMYDSNPDIDETLPRKWVIPAIRRKSAHTGLHPHLNLISEITSIRPFGFQDDMVIVRLTGVAKHSASMVVRKCRPRIGHECVMREEQRHDSLLVRHWKIFSVGNRCLFPVSWKSLSHLEKQVRDISCV